MQSIMQKTYHIFWAIFIVLFVVMLAFFDLSIRDQNEKSGYEIITDYETYTYEDSAAPIGIRQVYRFRPYGIDKSYCSLLIFTVHQEVKVYVDEQCVYRMDAKEIDVSGRSPGCVWNQVSFSELDNGHVVEVEIAPVYKSSVDIVPIFYFGSRADITRDIIMRNLPIISLSLVTIVIGIIYIGFILYNYKKSDMERGLLMLGYFAVQVGLWKLTDSEAITMMLPGYPVLSQVPFMALMFMGVSFSLFLKELYSTREHKVWYILAIYGFVNMGLTILLQILGIADMRQMLVFTHIHIVLIVIVSIGMTIYEVKSVGWNSRIKRNLFCMGICFIGAGIDMVLYYAFNGQVSTVLGMLGFMTYIFVMGVGSMQEIKKLMDIGIKAQQYEKMAYHDQLTGLFNRTAFAEHTGDVDFVNEKCIIIVMDLNNLKSCNDQLGHDKGDIYIKECARMIKESFEDIGRCYRMGGDEFHVLLTNGDLHLCKQRLQALKERVANCKIIDGFRMGIACGYKMYDRLLDYDIHETARRADKVMYQEKFAMKEL